MRPKNPAKATAIRTVALRIISEEGLENLSMQKLAKAANVSPRTIYLTYENKEDLLIKLFIDEVLGSYEKAILEGFSEDMGFAEGVETLWLNGFRYLAANPAGFALMQYGKSSPLLNKAFRERNIQEGQFFAPIHRFLRRHTEGKKIAPLPFEAQRALLFAPLTDLVQEYIEHSERIPETVVRAACAIAIKGITI
ncbi:MAG TPA: TetR/AcrR family transcriptional regulator [Dinghuibacter sp.]|jgi:AcrR family transcriptional regulator|uniref:TetR/AcrR family transcriptional regulator n=1 Tax=Dinghuibacter sp. TaxID=2024697 RepID=UPI002C8689C2|nr:TetR/AcrR family transcriptional regulator [Dinghuibacter sp.]HTJ14641.1 TetR/AcrR family transcriptional regulator [Dinghuibacter sp.]